MTRTEKLHEEYESVVDCIKLPQGTIVEQYGYPLWGRFIVRDGKVFQRDAGPLHHEKRTKKAKRMMALSNYPRKKLYKSFEEYAEERCGFSFDEKHQGYGYYYNPNAIWDWYSIGETSWCNSGKKAEAPEGYLWVCAARKKDIAWEEMRNWRNQKAKERFYKLERMFLSGKTDSGFDGEIVSDGVMHWGRIRLSEKALRWRNTIEEYGIQTAGSTRWLTRYCGCRPVAEY